MMNRKCDLKLTLHEGVISTRLLAAHHVGDLPAAQHYEDGHH